MSKCASALYKRIAVLLAEKTGEPYSLTMAFIRCRLSVALIRASVMCVRGSRSIFLPMLLSRHLQLWSLRTHPLWLTEYCHIDCFHSHTSSFSLLIICHGGPRKSKYLAGQGWAFFLFLSRNRENPKSQPCRTPRNCRNWAIAGHRRS